MRNIAHLPHRELYKVFELTSECNYVKIRFCVCNQVNGMWQVVTTYRSFRQECLNKLFIFRLRDIRMLTGTGTHKHKQTQTYNLQTTQMLLLDDESTQNQIDKVVSAAACRWN